ncbi:Stp1/IreP family PP2C-type Ser/Thr phosphatase [Streptomyces goshikiensis]
MAQDRLYPEPTGEVRMSLSLRFAAGSHKGMIREGNEDSGYAGPRLLAIADGMGGQAAGEVASSEVISTLVQLDDDVPGSDILTSLATAVQRANDQLRVMVEEDPQLEGMGTTLTALLWTGQRLGLVHVGDSRAYLLRDGLLTQITQDHTWVQRLVDEGRITEEEATTHPPALPAHAGARQRRHRRTRPLHPRGPGRRPLPDLFRRALRRRLPPDPGRDPRRLPRPPHETVQALIQLALRGGGPDNITCIVADVLSTDSGDTLAAQLNDTPVVVGAVAENQHQLFDGNAMQTPAGRASGLGRQASPPAGSFGPPGSGENPGYGFPEQSQGGGYGGGGGYGDPEANSFEGDQRYEDTYDHPRRRRGKGRKWTTRTLLLLIVAGAIGGGLYGAHRWTQTQYYVGVKGEHVALYRGISQNLGWIHLNQVETDHPDIELKYLPPFKRKQVEATITENSLDGARQKIDELGVQVSACKKDEERRNAEPQNAQTPSPSLTPAEQALVGLCGK